MSATASTSPHTLRNQLLPWGYRAALAACLLDGVWLGCLIYLQSTGSVDVQARVHPQIFRVSVGSALLLTLAQVPILLAAGLLAFRSHPARSLVASVLYALYVPINLTGYFSYGRLAPMVHTPPVSGQPGSDVIASIIQIGHPLGITGNLPILGYGLLGLAWCLLAPSLWSLGKPARVTAVLLFTSGLLSVLGATGSFTGVDWLAASCLLGGVVSLPAMALLGITLWSVSREREQ